MTKLGDLDKLPKYREGIDDEQPEKGDLISDDEDQEPEVEEEEPEPLRKD